VENISRLACDELEDNRLASYTEKSSRYQVLDSGSYHVPQELRGHALESVYVETCDYLFDVYHQLLEQTQDYLRRRDPQREGERDSAFRLRIRRIATDHCRFVLPASTLTNVGVTINARGLEHAITKLLSSELAESREVGERLKQEGRAIAPTLVKYADVSDYIAGGRKAERASSWYRGPATDEDRGPGEVIARLVSYDQAAEEKLATAILYRVSSSSHDEIMQFVAAMTPAEREQAIESALSGLGPFDAPLRETELIDYVFEMEMDYGAYREYRRHRMQTTIPQRLEVSRGYVSPFVVEEAGAADLFHEAMATADRAYARLAEESPDLAEYVVTHAHKRRLLAKMNLRECYHLLKLRSAEQAHFTIREIALKCLDELRRVHPLLINFIQLRD
jgi:thymidylate synthase ThyX